MISDRTAGTIAVVAAILVLLSAMWQPWVSAALAIGALLGFAALSFFRDR